MTDWRATSRSGYRAATVVAIDPVALTFDADFPEAGVVAGIEVDRPEKMPAAGDPVLLRMDGAVPVYADLSRIRPIVTDSATGETLASMDEDGQVSGQVGSFGTLYVGGGLWDPNKGPRGNLAHGEQFTTTAATTTELGVGEIIADLEVGRRYQVETTSLDLQSTVDGTVVRAKIRFTDDGTTPTITSELLCTTSKLDDAGDVTLPMKRRFTPAQSGVHRFLLTVAHIGGSGDAKIFGREDFPIQMWLDDVGADRGDTFIANDGGGGATSPKQTLSKRYFPVWSASYGTTYTSLVGTEMRQGQFSGVNWRGLVGFDYAQIMSDLAGAAIQKCTGYLYLSKRYGTSFTAIVGTHGHGARPDLFSATEDRWTVPWPGVGVGRLIDLGIGVGQEFKSGTTRGLSVGTAPSSSLIYAGHFHGEGMTHLPYVEIEYVK